MAKQKVIPGPHQPQFEVSPEALTSELALFSPSFLSSYVSLCSKNPKRTIWQNQVQVIVEQMHELIDKKESPFLNAELLKKAIEKREVEKVRSLLGEEIKLELLPEGVNQLVKSAIDSDQDQIVDALAKSDQIDINSFRCGGIPQGALDYAISSSRFGVAKVLANNLKIDINSVDIANKVVHSIFSIVNKINESQHNKSTQDRLEEVVKILVSRQIDVNVKNYRTKLTLLHQAIQYDNLSMFKVLLTHPNIDIKVQANCMLTPLDYAVACNSVEMVGDLLAKYHEQGNNIKNEYLNRALCHVQSREVFQLLVDVGADIDAKVGTQSFTEKCNSDDQYFQKQKEWLLEYGGNSKSTKSSVKSKQEVPEEKQDTDIHLAGEYKQEVSEEVQEGA